MLKHSARQARSWLSPVIGSVFLGTCATASIDCPPLPEYSKQDQLETAEEIDKYGNKVPRLVEKVDDYGRVRMACREIG